MADKDIQVPQEDSAGKFIAKTISPSGEGILTFSTTGVPTFVAKSTVIADLGAFTDPPTAGEMATLRTTVNSILAALRSKKIIDT